MSGGNIAQGGGDPRMSISGDGTALTRPQLLGVRDPNVKFEE